MKTRLLQLAFTFALVLGVTVALSRAQPPAHRDLDERVSVPAQGFTAPSNVLSAP